MYSLVKVLFMIRAPLKTVWPDLIIGVRVYPFSCNYVLPREENN